MYLPIGLEEINLMSEEANKSKDNGQQTGNAGRPQPVTAPLEAGKEKPIISPGQEGFIEEEGLQNVQTSLLTFGYERGGAVIKPEDEGKTKGLGVRAMEEQTRRELDMLEEQAKVILAQATAIKRRKELSERIYNATIRFEPLIGRTYFLYDKDGGDILSLIAPHEWGRSKGYNNYIAKLRLLHDHTWEVLEDAGL